MASGTEPPRSFSMTSRTASRLLGRSVPIVTIRFAFGGGSTQDPAGKAGLANLMSGLFDEGAGDMDSDAFQIRLDDAGAEMAFGERTDEAALQAFTTSRRIQGQRCVQVPPPRSVAFDARVQRIQ